MSIAPRQADRLPDLRDLRRAALLSHCANTPERTPKKLHQTDFFHPTMAPMWHGWLLPHLIAVDDAVWGRWDHWMRTRLAGQMLDEPIPPIQFICEASPGYTARGHIEYCLRNVTLHGDWRGWSSWTYFDYFCDWLLFGFGHDAQRELPPEPHGCEGAANRLYQVFTLERLSAAPHDYFGDILAENRHGRHLGFFPTPMQVCVFMTQMNFVDGAKRDQTVCDPALGTGRMLLTASNYSYRLYGMDINPTVIKASLINGYLYAPWLVKPFPFFDTPTTL